MEEEFRRWLQGRAASEPPIAFLRAEESETVVLSISWPRRPAVELSLVAVEDASFFAEGLGEVPDEVEDWLVLINSEMSDKPRMTFVEALDTIAEKLPREGQDMAVDPEEEEEEDEHIDVVLEDIQPSEDRRQQRDSFQEERTWESLVRSPVPQGQGSHQASQVLMRELRALMQIQGEGFTKALSVDLVQDSLYCWCVKMHANSFPDDCLLKGDLMKLASWSSSSSPEIVFEVLFPNEYPMQPPFIRVKRPRFQQWTGHVTVGGSICMQLLTPSGWLPTVSLENIFVNIRSEMIEGGGRLDMQHTAAYSEAEAREAFNRVARRYGWL
mmetsp:Transcript_62041/g.134593  ORF Transcript_62041/g.134593 Transcript_62041/m.134593 type:complete len:327 (-) Transcript_62041:93-1073(-)